MATLPEGLVRSDIPSDLSFTVPIYNVFSLESTLLVHCSQESMFVAIDVALRGYLSRTPMKPSAMVSFKTLDLLHCIHLWKPSMSIEAFTKVVSDYYNVSLVFYRSLLVDPNHFS